MTVTLNLKPEVEAGLSAGARATGMTLELYLQRLVEKELSAGVFESASTDGSGTVWEDGLLIYGVGTTLHAGYIDEALRRSRNERWQRFPGLRD